MCIYVCPSLTDPPQILPNALSNVTIIENHRVTLSCPVTGTPRPRITWYKDAVLITGNEIGVRILADGGLQLDTPGAGDTARYECLAENVAGNTTLVVDLKVYCECRSLFVKTMKPYRFTIFYPKFRKLEKLRKQKRPGMCLV